MLIEQSTYLFPLILPNLLGLRIRLDGVPFLVDPLADVGRAVSQPGAERLAQGQEEHGIPVDELYLFQIKEDSLRRRFRPQQREELGYLLCLYPTCESENHPFALFRFLNSQRHRVQLSAQDKCNPDANLIWLKI